jgi:two-component system response regulator TctD
MRVLIAEDNVALATSLAQALTAEGMVVDTVNDGLHADQILRSAVFDVVVLDLTMPRMDGLDVLRRLRARGASVPVIVLTARGEPRDRIEGLDAGADDYLPKPFDLGELEARIRALVRRAQGRAVNSVVVGGLEWNPALRQAAVRGCELNLPPRERAILELLLAGAGRPVGKDALADRLTTMDTVVSTEAIEIYVCRLRRRLEGSGTEIRTLRGLGYLLQEADG